MVGASVTTGPTTPIPSLAKEGSGFPGDRGCMPKSNPIEMALSQNLWVISLGSG